MSGKLKNQAEAVEDAPASPEVLRDEIDALCKMLIFASRNARRIGGHDAANLVDQAVHKLESDLTRRTLN